MKLQTEKRLKALSPFFLHKGKSVALASMRKVRSDPNSAEHPCSSREQGEHPALLPHMLPDPEHLCCVFSVLVC